MINFEKPADSPTPYCVVELSNGQVIYESNEYTFWRELKNFCKKNGNLSVKKVSIIVGDKPNPIKKNNARHYFIIRNGRMSLRRGVSEIKKGYGVVCVHPGDIKKTYISWYNDDTGKFLYDEVLRGGSELYEKEIGISAN